MHGRHQPQRYRRAYHRDLPGLHYRPRQRRLSQQTITVTLGVNSATGVVVSPTTLVYSYQPGGSLPQAQTVSVNSSPDRSDLLRHRDAVPAGLMFRRTALRCPARSS